MKMPLIDASYKLPKWRIFLEAAFSVLMTLGVWAVLLLGIVPTAFGSAAKRQQSGRMFLFLFILAVIIFLLFAAWQYYNWHRFHGKDRRKAFAPQPLEEVGHLYGIELKDMEKLQGRFRSADVIYQDGRYYYQLPGENPIAITALDERKAKI